MRSDDWLQERDWFLFRMWLILRFPFRFILPSGSFKIKTDDRPQRLTIHIFSLQENDHVLTKLNASLALETIHK